MAAHLNSEVSPLRIDNVEMVVIDEGPVFGPPQHYFTVAIIFGLPNQGRSFGNENGKHPSELGIGGGKIFGRGGAWFCGGPERRERGSLFLARGVRRA